MPVGLGSGICGVIAAKQAAGVDTEIVGVVAANANAYQLSFAEGRPIGTNSADTLADGLAVRNPSSDALSLIREAVGEVVAVTDDEIMKAIGYYFSDTHNVAEGAGAAPLAALINDEAAMAGKRVGLVLTGGNINHALFSRALAMSQNTG